MKTLVQKILLTALISLFMLDAQGVTYYISAASGNDSYTAAQATNPSTPWRSIEKLNAIMSTLKPGDSVLFKRGETFYGTMVLRVSGTASSKIYFGAYGSGSEPVLSGATRLTNWKSVGNGIFEAVHANLIDQPVNVLVFNGKNQEMGRYPNSDANNKGYLNFEDVISTNILVDNEWQGGTNWAGAEVVVRKNAWIIDRMAVTGISGNQITFNPATGSTYGVKKGWGYFVQNHMSALDQLGEWYYNRSTRKMYVYFGSQNPANFDVQVGTANSIITNSGRVADIVIESLELFAANVDAIALTSANNMTFSKLKVTYAGVNGIQMGSSNNPIIDGVTILNANNNSIVLRSADGGQIRNNTIVGTFNFPGMGVNGDNNGNAIFSSNGNTVIENNKVLNSGYIGIRFGGNNTIVRNNVVDTYGLVKNDGGGIYTYTGSSNAELFNRKVLNNIVVNGVGVREGTDITSPMFKPQVEGIYMDDNSSGVEIAYNTVFNVASKGIYLHNARRIHVHDNLVYNTATHLFFGSDNLGADIVENTIEKNVFVSKNKEEFNLSFLSIADDVKAMGNFSNNIYANPFSDNFRTSTRVNKGTSNEKITLYGLDSWRKAYDTDYGSTNYPYVVEQFTVNKLVGENRFPNPVFTSNILNVGTNGCTAAWDANAGLDGGAVRLSGSGSFAGVFAIGAVSANKDYVLTFSGRANINVPARVFLRLGGSPWSEITPSSNIGFDVARSEYKIHLSPLENADKAVVMVRFEGVPAMNAWIDNFVFTEAEVKIANPNEHIFFEYNATDVAKSFSLSGVYYDIANKRYIGQVTVAPYSSVLLFKSLTESAQPEIRLALPTEDGNVNGTSLTVGLTISGNQEWIKTVRYFNADTLVATADKAPFGFEWQKMRTGSYVLHAEASNDSGEKVASPAVNVQFTRPEILPLVDLELACDPNGLMPGDPVLLRSVAFAPDGDIEKVDIYRDGALLTTLTAEPYEFSWVSNTSGDFKVYANAFNEFGLSSFSDTLQVTINKLPAGVDVNALKVANGMHAVFLNAGAGSSTIVETVGFDGEGSANAFYSASSTHTNTNASDMVLFQSERHAPVLTYKIPVPNGEYKVVTFHNELWFGKSGPAQQAGQRVYDIQIQGEMKIERFDLFNYSRNLPAMLVFEGVSVTEEMLDITLQAHTNRASISGIAVIQMSKPTPVFIMPVAKPVEIAPFFELHLNAGDSRTIDVNNSQFLADQSMSTIFTASNTFRNADASEFEVMQTERNGSKFSYHIPVENGTYTVVTYHNELWFGKKGPAAAAGRRVFDISIEGEMKMKGFDIFVHNENRPTSLVFEQVKVTDGTLTLDFAATKDRASISGISIYGIEKEPPFNLFVKTGATSNTMFAKYEFIAEDGLKGLTYTNSWTNTNPTACFEPLFLSERTAKTLHYAIPVPNGVYTISTMHNELWFGKGGPAAAAGRRVFDISLEGVIVRKNFDLYRASRNKSFILTFKNIEVTDGVLNLSMDASVYNATISGFAVMTEIKQDPVKTENMIRGFREMVLMTEEGGEMMEEAPHTIASSSQIYPNPARDFVNISLGQQDVTPDYFYIHDISGKLVHGVQPSEVRSQNGYQFSVNQLPEGLYLVSVMTENVVSDRFKLIVTK